MSHGAGTDTDHARRHASEAGASSIGSWAAPGPLAKAGKRGLTAALKLVGIGTDRTDKALSVFTSPMALQAELVTQAPEAAALHARMSSKRPSRAASAAAQRRALDCFSELTTPGESHKHRRQSSGSSSAGSLQIASAPGAAPAAERAAPAHDAHAAAHSRQSRRHRRSRSSRTPRGSPTGQAQRSVTQLQRLSGTMMPGGDAWHEGAPPPPARRSSSPARRQQAAKSASQLDMLMSASQQSPSPGGYDTALSMPPQAHQRDAAQPASFAARAYQQQDSLSYTTPASSAAHLPGQHMPLLTQYDDPGSTHPPKDGRMPTMMNGTSTSWPSQSSHQRQLAAQEAAVGRYRSTQRAGDVQLVSRTGQLLQEQHHQAR